MAENKTIIIWFRDDLRLEDNPALSNAIKTANKEGMSILFLYIQEVGSKPERGAAAKWWLHHSLISLNASLKENGARLTLLKGDAVEIFKTLAKSLPLHHVFWNRRFTPGGIAVDTTIKSWLKDQNINVTSCRGNFLAEPNRVLNAQGNPFQVFTPFWKHISTTLADFELSDKVEWRLPSVLYASLDITGLDLLPKIDWSQGFNSWKPGEAGAHQKLNDFLKTSIVDYKIARNRPDGITTSRLSPHLAFGEISIQRIFQNAQNAYHQGLAAKEDVDHFLSELGWRDFSTYQLYHFPDLAEKPIKPSFEKFHWNDSLDDLKKWKKGLTGYPIVDAGMRELWETGWMHNRVRMIVGSFLVKDLLLPWQWGEAWFWDTLLDADAGSNAASWQWVSGCGFDAAPYFRIFNPILQGEKFDPNGDYVKRFVPELAGLASEFIHKPWLAPVDILKKAKIELGETYPKPMVDHAVARNIALERFKALKGE